MLLAFAWVNSPAVEIYDLIHHTPLSLQVGAVGLSKPLVDWINEGLMVFFFFAIGLEIKREVLVGDLASPGAGRVGKWREWRSPSLLQPMQCLNTV